MACKKKKNETPGQRLDRLETRRQHLRHMHDRLLSLQDREAAANALLHHRLTICSRGSKCGRFICEELTKGPGVKLTFCVATGKQEELYPLLMDPDFECPKGLF